MKKFFRDFKAFITRGNIVDLAVAVVVGGAFGKIVTSLVNDIIMPFISLIVGGKSVADWKWVIKAAEYDAAGNLAVAESALHYGSFIQTIIDFLIISFFVFLAIKLLMGAQKSFGSLTDKTAKEHRAHVKALKKQGLDKAQIEARLAEEKAEAEAKAEAEKMPAPPTTEQLLAEIRDLLAKEREAQ